MEHLLNGLHFIYLAALLGGFSAGWGVRVVRALQLPDAFVLPTGFAVFALGAYGVFFAYFAAPLPGKIVALVWGVVSLAVFICEWRTENGRATLVSREAWLPGVWMILLAACWLALLGTHNLSPAQRFTWDLPSDNELPRIFADRLAAGVSPTPLSGDWLSSDRPPLQTGLELSLRPWHLRHQPLLNYHLSAILLQLLWLPALFALGRVLRLGREALFFVLLTCAASGFFLLNSLYVWPKLLAAALFLTALGVLLKAVRDSAATAGHAVFSAGCMTLALLAHGGVAFSVLALPALPSAWSFLGLVRRRGLVAAIAAFIMLYAPWSAYQKLYDPPGDRLWKWHIAGIVPIDHRSFPETLRDQYAQLTFDQWLLAKKVNFSTFVFNPDIKMSGLYSADSLRHAQFFNLAPALDVLLIGILAIILSRQRHNRADAPIFLQQLLLYATATSVLWAVVMFIPGSTVIHQGSYATTALFFFLGAAGLTGFRPPIRWSLWLVHAGIFIWVWIATTPQTAGKVLQLPVAIICALLGICFILSLRLMPADV